MSTTFPMRVKPVDLGHLEGRQEAVRIKMGPFAEGDSTAMVKTFLNYPEFSRSLGRLTTRVSLTSDLPPRLARLAALRAAWLCDSEYLWAHLREDAALNDHLLDAVARAGTSDAPSDATTGPTTGAASGPTTGGASGGATGGASGGTSGPTTGGASGGTSGPASGGASERLTGIERHAIEAIDELHHTHHLSDEKWYRIDRLGPNALLDLMSTYAVVVTLAAAGNSMGVQLEDGLTGWDREHVIPDTTKAAPRTLLKRVFEADYADLSPEQIEQTNRMGRRGKPTTSKLQKAMINYPAFGRSMSSFGKRAIDDTSLPTRVWQLACMRTVWLCDSEYLWSQHRKACLKIGVTDQDLLGVAEGPASPNLRGFDRTIVSAVDDLYYNNRLSDENWDKFDEFGSEGVTDLILVYGLYVLQSCVARNFGTTLEDGSLGYLPELDAFRSLQHVR
ncbi:carboxymuconolactone decarboxylase family protein [Cryptosporangium sp. NPDC048952]|uniref:carboxymuconolactone decarboxylase family protein n=1 Tax=Cryptosporangium sp. NPDC048952 TaxID=3363961 RepID=UPI00371E83AF